MTIDNLHAGFWCKLRLFPNKACKRQWKQEFTVKTVVDCTKRTRNLQDVLAWKSNAVLSETFKIYFLFLSAIARNWSFFSVCKQTFCSLFAYWTTLIEMPGIYTKESRLQDRRETPSSRLKRISLSSVATLNHCGIIQLEKISVTVSLKGKQFRPRELTISRNKWTLQTRNERNDETKRNETKHFIHSCTYIAV